MCQSDLWPLLNNHSTVTGANIHLYSLVSLKPSNGINVELAYVRQYIPTLISMYATVNGLHACQFNV